MPPRYKLLLSLRDQLPEIRQTDDSQTVASAFEFSQGRTMSPQELANFRRIVEALESFLPRLLRLMQSDPLKRREIDAAQLAVQKFVVRATESAPCDRRERRACIYRCSVRRRKAILGREHNRLLTQIDCLRNSDVKLIVSVEQFELMQKLADKLLNFALVGQDDYELEQHAKELRAAAVKFCELRTGETWKPNTPAIVIVDVNKLIAECFGKTFDLSSQQAARWLKVLGDHPGEWISGKLLSDYDNELADVRTDKLKKTLPDTIRCLIESQPRRGSRLKLEHQLGRKKAVFRP